MRDVAANVLIGLGVAILATGLWDWLTQKNVPLWLKLIGAVVSILSAVLLQIWANVRKACGWLIRRIQEKFQSLRRPAEGLPDLFSFNKEPIHVIYTCRASLNDRPAFCPSLSASEMKEKECVVRRGAEACPFTESAAPNGAVCENLRDASCPFVDSSKLQHTILTHVPVDEFFSFHSIVESYAGQLCGQDREVLMERLHCSRHLESFPEKADCKAGEKWLPDFLFENLIVIGENDCSRVILDQLKPVLSIDYLREKLEELVPGATQKFVVSLDFRPYGGSQISGPDKGQLRTDRGAHGEDRNGRAVAMICYAPNPFNCQKKVLLLFGCHRFGQVLLEDMGRYDLKKVFRQIRGLLASGGPCTTRFGQIAIHGQFTASSEEAWEFHSTGAIVNSRLNAPFFPLRVPDDLIRTGGFCRDERAIGEKSMVDVSLIARLGEPTRDLTARIGEFTESKLSFLSGPYLECETDVGLHVTMYEFAHQEPAGNLNDARAGFERLGEGLRKAFAASPSTILMLAGIEVLSSKIRIRAYLPPTFVDRVQRKCHEAGEKIPYFNRESKGMPFPLHCTVVRLREGVSGDAEDKLRQLEQEYRNHFFGTVPLAELSLVLATKQPFRQAEKVAPVRLGGKGGSKRS